MPFTDMSNVVNEMQSRFEEIQKVRRVSPGEHVVRFICSKEYTEKESALIRIFCEEFYRKNEKLFPCEEGFWGSLKYFSDLQSSNPSAQEISQIARRKIIEMVSP